MVRLRFDDELIAYEWDRQEYSKPRHREINEHLARKICLDLGVPPPSA